MVSTSLANGSVTSWPSLVAPSLAAVVHPVLHQPFVIGPGCSPIPSKLVTQIVGGKYVDLSELIAANLTEAQNEPQLLLDGRIVLSTTPRRQRRRIDDIVTWLEAFSIFKLVLVSYFPQRWADLSRYQLLILRTHRQLNGRAWLTYDRAFREHVAATKTTDCSTRSTPSCTASILRDLSPGGRRTRPLKQRDPTRVIPFVSRGIMANALRSTSPAGFPTSAAPAMGHTECWTASIPLKGNMDHRISRATSPSAVEGVAGIQEGSAFGSPRPYSDPTPYASRVDQSSLESQCQIFLLNGLAPTTRRTYASAQRKYIDFCSQLGRQSACPADEKTLSLFITFLAQTLQHRSIKVYLSAVRSLHIEQGFADPLANCVRLQQVFRGIKRSQGSPTPQRLPITDSLMQVIFKALDLKLFNHAMFWAACTLEYFGFLRSAEFTVPNLSNFSTSIHLQVSDLAFDNLTEPSCLRVLVKASKTDPFRKGCRVHIGRGRFPLCAVSAIAVYLNIRGDSPGPLFLLDDGRPLSLK
ncbi:hypothetical protein QZH41_020373, partial [Actinostola sp. cb2023]